MDEEVSFEDYNQQFIIGHAQREDNLQQLNGHHHVYNATEAKQTEKYMFNVLMWAHLATFFLIPITFYLKQKEYYNIKQFMQFSIMSVFFVAQFFIIF